MHHHMHCIPNAFFSAVLCVSASQHNPVIRVGCTFKVGHKVENTQTHTLREASQPNSQTEQIKCKQRNNNNNNNRNLNFVHLKKYRLPYIDRIHCLYTCNSIFIWNELNWTEVTTTKNVRLQHEAISQNYEH